MQTGNLKEKYLKEIRNKLKKELGKKNIYEVPGLVKIVINVGFGKISADSKVKDLISENLKKISGQKPVFTVAKKAIAGFKIRKGQTIGAKVTLRGDKMYHFYKKLVSIVFPRLRDFRGVKEKSFDNKGSFTLGFAEINVFPEIEYNRMDKATGLEVTICTSAKSKDEAKALLLDLGMPFPEIQQKI